MKNPRISWHCLVVCLLVSSAVTVSAQSPEAILGCVQDSTKAVIPNTLIILTSSDGSKRSQAETDEKGCFTISGLSNGRYHLEIVAEAFAPLETNVDVQENTDLGTVVLNVQPLRNGVVVTATRTPSPSMTLGASVDVIDRSQIETSNARETIDLLRDVAGLDVVRSGDAGAITSLFTRGGESDYTKVLVDGIPLNQPGGAYDFSHLSTDNVSRIEVVRGPQSALFGSDAISGVVQIFTRQGSGPPQLEYSVDGGSFNTTDQQGALSGGFKRFDYSNTFSRFDTDNVGANNKYRNSSYSGNFGFDLNPRQSLRATLMYGDARAGTPGDNAPGFISYDGPNDYMTRVERAGGLTYHALVGSRMTQHLAYRIYDHKQYFYSDYGVSSVLQTRHRLEYHGDIALPVGGTFSYGVDYDRENASVGTDRHFRNNTGVYVQQQFNLGRKLDITAGLRMEDNTTFGTSANPHLGVSYRWLPATRLRFNAGTGIKEPSFIENFSTSSYYLGNPSLLPEQSRSWDAGIEQSFWKDRIVADLGWFDGRFSNMIELVAQPDGSSKYYNVSRSVARGTEARVRGRIGRFSAQTNYTYLDGQVTASDQTSFPYRPGDPLLRRPKHSGDVTMTWDEKQWSAQWTTRYVGQRADSDFYTYATPLFSNPSYWSSDASFTYTFSSHFAAFVRSENVFDRTYQEILGYQALGRGAVAGIRVRAGGGR